MTKLHSNSRMKQEFSQTYILYRRIVNLLREPLGGVGTEDGLGVGLFILTPPIVLLTALFAFLRGWGSGSFMFASPSPS
jgi:hypothetical protein